MVLRSASGGSGGDEEGKEKGEKEGESDGEDGTEFEALIPAGAKHHAITQVTVPDNFPEVPMLPVSRNPIFPRFVRMLEVWILYLCWSTDIPSLPACDLWYNENRSAIGS